jgi:hypothetical protein
MLRYSAQKSTISVWSSELSTAPRPLAKDWVLHEVYYSVLAEIIVTPLWGLACRTDNAGPFLPKI